MRSRLSKERVGLRCRPHLLVEFANRVLHVRLDRVLYIPTAPKERGREAERGEHQYMHACGVGEGGLARLLPL